MRSVEEVKSKHKDCRPDKQHSPDHFFFYNIINHKQTLTKYYNHQEHTYCYLGGYKNTMVEQKLLKHITKIKILKEKRKVQNIYIIK